MSLWVALVVCLVALTALWVGQRDEKRVLPQSLCGTRITPNDLEPLIPAEGAITERNDVDRSDPSPSSWCSLNVGGKEAVDVRFAWHSDLVDPLEIANSLNSISQLQMPERVNKAPDMVVGNDGAIATTTCRSKRGAYFTLSVLLKAGNPTDTGHRRDIEKFMRAYFPATVKTLKCG
ncbi:hypothetical protein ABZ023_08060 [Streptomyces sp. NPDC006367]|uniref:hypothetical protein n=1 Tax=unclassified Streptomyces TaxID=2593676 RepID=UPI0033A7BD56